MATAPQDNYRSLDAVPIKLASPDVGDDEIQAVAVAMRSGILTNGPYTAAFEDAMARRHSVEHAVAFANGTVALTAIYLGLGIRRGDEVIVPSMTFISTATALLHIGATPVFAEVDEDTFNLDPADVEARITSRTKAIVAVHYGGQPADLDELRAIADAAGLDLVEDAAQAHGAVYRGRPVGGFGRAAMFSFTPTKHITTGEGGVVTTNDAELASRLRLLRNHGQTRLYEHAMVGYNWRMSEMQAAMGVVQVPKLDAVLSRKATNDAYLRGLFDGFDIVQLPRTQPDRTHPYMLYTLKVPERLRDETMETLIESGVEARLYFPPAHCQQIFREHGRTLPRTERLAGQMVSIPFHSKLEPADLDQIADTVKSSLLVARGR